MVLACLLLAALLLAACGGNNAPGSYLYAAPPASTGPAPSESGSDTAASHSLGAEAAGLMQGEVVEIREKMFIAQSNDIYLNPEDYLGKTLTYEGMFFTTSDPFSGTHTYYVIRFGPGCCGYDGEAGFEVIWPEGEEAPYPEDNAWVQVLGTLEEYDRNGWPTLRVRLQSLTKKEERGQETVLQ